MTSSVKKIAQENPKDFSQKMTKAIGDLNDFSTLQIKVNGKSYFLQKSAFLRFLKYFGEMIKSKNFERILSTLF